jgi:alcohol dehydrogenase
MKALVYQGPGRKALEERPMPEIKAPGDAIVKIVKTTICGTDLHILKGDVPTCTPGRILGHEGQASSRRSASASRASARAIAC